MSHKMVGREQRLTRTVSGMDVNPQDPKTEHQLPEGPPPIESVDGPLYDDLGLGDRGQAERAMRALVNQTLGEYWLLEGPTMAAALCAAAQRRLLPDALPECDVTPAQLASQYAQLVAGGVEEGFDGAAVGGELQSLTLVRLLVTDAAQGQLPAPLWSMLYAMGGVYRQAAALLLATQLLSDALEGGAVTPLGDVAHCAAFDLVQVLTDGQIEQLGEDAALARVDDIARLLAAVSQLAKQYVKLLAGVRDLAELVEDVSDCADCKESLVRFGEQSTELPSEQSAGWDTGGYPGSGVAGWS